MNTLSQVNTMTAAEFVAAFGDVAEHSPWVAENAARVRPFASREDMVDAFEHATRKASHEMQLTLLRAHPDLATRARLTDDSTREQAQAGLGNLDAAEFARFTRLNDTYKARFGFPFIFAVKGATKQQILTSFEERIDKSVEDEFEMALAQVMRIFRFRIEDRVQA